MSDTVSLDLPKSAIEGAARRVATLLDNGYLPKQLESDIRVLLNGAMAWDISTGRQDLPR